MHIYSDHAAAENSIRQISSMLEYRRRVARSIKNSENEGGLSDDRRYIDLETAAITINSKQDPEAYAACLAMLKKHLHDIDAELAKEGIVVEPVVCEDSTGNLVLVVPAK